jgi:hypothetical protein
LRRPGHARHHRGGQPRDTARCGPRLERELGENGRRAFAAGSELGSGFDLRHETGRNSETGCDVLYQATAHQLRQNVLDSTHHGNRRALLHFERHVATAGQSRKHAAALLVLGVEVRRPGELGQAALTPRIAAVPAAC